MSFNHLKKFDVSKEAVPYTLFMLDGEPKLLLLPGTEANKAYHNALLKRNAKLAQRFRAVGTGMDRATLIELRDHDRVLYAKFVITAWEGILDDDGNEVPFSTDVCKQFLAQLPNWIFDDMRQFASNPANFLQDDDPSKADEEDLSGN